MVHRTPGHCLPMTRDNAHRREWYARQRVRHLRERLPELPEEVTPELMAKLRRISVGAFRAGEGKQTLLARFAFGTSPPPPTGDAEAPVVRHSAASRAALAATTWSGNVAASRSGSVAASQRIDLD